MTKLENKIYKILLKQEKKYGQVIPFKKRIVKAIVISMPSKVECNPGYNKAIEDMEN